MSNLIHVPTPQYHDPVELEVLRKLRETPGEMIDLYLAKYRVEEITFVARDAAKRVFPEYKEDTTNRNRLVDAAASALADAIRQLCLSSPPSHSRDHIRLVTGAPASGKTIVTSTLRLPSTEMIHETILTSAEKAHRLVQEAFAAGRQMTIHLLYTDDPRINVRRMISRARRIGRTVPLAYCAEAYSGVPRIVQQLRSAFGVDLPLILANNSGLAEEIRFHSDIDHVVKMTGRYTKSQCLERMDDELNEIHANEEIPQDILREARRR